MSKNIEKVEKEKVSKKHENISYLPLAKNNIFIAAFISFFTVVFLWGFWSKGIYALGFNATIFWILISTLFLYGSNDIGDFLKKNLYWMIPIFGIVMSFSIYENPFLKLINFFLLPLIVFFFFSYTKTKIDGNPQWSWWLLYKTFARKIPTERATDEVMHSFKYSEKTGTITKKIGIGVVILFLVNLIILSLLTSADSNFSEIIYHTFNALNLGNIVDIQIIFKVCAGIILLVFLTGLKISWQQEHTVKNIIHEKNIDSIIAGIVIGGTLITYFVFIGSQIDAITTNTIPKTTDEVVSLAKNGFWQLFFVSIINIVFFFVYFRKTNPIVQNLLFTFIVASIAILISAGHKMYIYVYNYGLSYEKLFASYTVLYFGVMFLIMLYFILSKKNVDIIRASLLTALIMYSFLNVFPTEKFIFHTNTNISLRADSRISKYQSHILSTDIYKSVQKLKGTDLYTYQDWDAWVQKQITQLEDRKWYEKNINNIGVK